MVRRWTAAVMLVVAMALVVATPPNMAWADKASHRAGATETIDRLILLSGRVVEGTITEETDDEIFMEVRIGSLTTPTRYLITDVLKIERGVAIATEGVVAEEEEEEEVEKTWDPDAAKIYLLELEGLFGTDITETPLQDAMDDVNETFGDLIKNRDPNRDVDYIVNPEVRDRHILVIKMDCVSDPRQTHNAVFKAEELGPILEKEMQQRGRRVVFWIKEAADGAMFLPWLSSEIYWHPEGNMWFQQDLEDFSSGDAMVDEKLISARLGHYHGFAIDGGYGELGPQIINAMARSRYWLSYRLEGGDPVLSNREYTDEMEEDGWVLLSDNGKGSNKDKDVKAIRSFNDRVVLNARNAEILGISKGVARNSRDLAFHLEVGRNYEVISGNSEEIFEDWVERKEESWRQIAPRQTRQYPLGELWEKFATIRVEGNYYDQKKARRAQIATLKKIRGWAVRFGEVWDPSGQWVGQLNVQIEQIKKSQQLADAAFRDALTNR